MKLEIHQCDRCEKEIRYPWDGLYVVTLHRFEEDPNFTDKWEVCGLCYEAIVCKVRGEEIPEGLAGVIKHEKELYESNVEEEEEDEVS